MISPGNNHTLTFSNPDDPTAAPRETARLMVGTDLAA